MTRQISTIGLKKYLNQTATKHREYRYDDFVKQVDAGMSVAALATMFGVSRMTIYKWLAHYEGVKDGDSNL